MDKLTETRVTYNKRIVEELTRFLEAHPGLRFMQALDILNLVGDDDRFYEEPYDTYEYIMDALRDLEGK